MEPVSPQVADVELRTAAVNWLEQGRPGEPQEPKSSLRHCCTDSSWESNTEPQGPLQSSSHRQAGWHWPEPPPLQQALPGLLLAVPQINSDCLYSKKNTPALSTEDRGANGAERKTENLRAAWSGGQQEQTEGRRLCPRGLGHPEASCHPMRPLEPVVNQHPSLFQVQAEQTTPTYLRVQVADQKDGIPCACQAWDGDAASGSSCSSRRYGKGGQRSVNIRNRET